MRTEELQLDCPKDANPETWATYVPALRQQIELLAKGGITILAVNPTDGNHYFKVHLGDFDAHISIGVLFGLTIPQLQAMLRILPQFINKVKDMLRGATKSYPTGPGNNYQGDVFYSDISLNLRDYNDYAARFLLYSLACGMLQSSRIWVHS